MTCKESVDRNFIRKTKNHLVNVSRNSIELLRDFSPIPTFSRFSEFCSYSCGFLIGEDSFFRGKYEEHSKDLINTIYNKQTRNGADLADPDFFGILAENRPKILQHFTTSKDKLGVDLSDIFFKIYDARTQKNSDLENKLKKQLSDEFLKLHNNINHELDFDFGYCSECVGKKTRIPFLARRKLKKIKS